MTSSPAARGWVEIDQNALSHNIRAIRAELGGSVGLCAVVKADAYGHGIDLVVPELMAQGVDRIGVASNDDAAAVRACGYRGRLIRVRPASAAEIAEARELGMEEWAGGPSHAEVIERVAAEQGAVIPVHVSLNSTGLSRDGFEVAAADDRLDRLLRSDRVRIVGVCAHFPCEDEADVVDGSRRFARESHAVLARMAAPGGGPAVELHCATTYAALHVPESRFDLVRIGAALYGDTPALGGALRPAMRVLSSVVAVNEYPRGSTVGYDRAHRLDRDARLAVIPLGYADGIHRTLSGTGHVLIRGIRARIVDRIAMNAFIVDVTDIDGAAPGDEVVLYGAQGEATITAEELARSHGSIAADLYVAWGRLLPRRAVRDGR